MYDFLLQQKQWKRTTLVGALYTGRRRWRQAFNIGHLPLYLRYGAASDWCSDPERWCSIGD